jgi:hypothetical protein
MNNDENVTLRAVALLSPVASSGRRPRHRAMLLLNAGLRSDNSGQLMY